MPTLITAWIVCHMNFFGLKNVGLIEGLSINFDLPELILSSNEAVHLKSSSSIMREFEHDKWGYLQKEKKKDPSITMAHIEKLEYGSENQFLYLNNKSYTCSPSFLRNYIKQLIRHHFCALLQKYHFKSILEIGAGYGPKIINLARYLKKIDYPLNRIYALDISKSGLQLANSFGYDEGIELITIQQDLRTNPTLSAIELPNAFMFSSYGLHYLRRFTTNNIEDWINSGVIAGVHFEPFSDFYHKLTNPLYKAFAEKYFIQQDYTPNLGIPFHDLAKQGLIDLTVNPVPCGFGLLPGWLLKWKIKSR